MEEEPIEEITVVIVDDVSVTFQGVRVWPLPIPAILLVGSILAVSLVALLLVFFAGKRHAL